MEDAEQEAKCGAPTLIRTIRDNPAAYYLNISTDDFPEGAVHGQLTNRAIGESPAAVERYLPYIAN